ncbi:hypothetical protein GRJ2_001927300 [Grus japonensis]|uniref:Uncharacterized protein n=1 Tax=Grus japonensis TaxID=30415 RepID=A0ABC9XAE2_GRUJA
MAWLVFLGSSASWLRQGEQMCSLVDKLKIKKCDSHRSCCLSHVGERKFLHPAVSLVPAGYVVPCISLQKACVMGQETFQLEKSVTVQAWPRSLGLASEDNRRDLCPFPNSWRSLESFPPLERMVWNADCSALDSFLQPCYGFSLG